MGVIIARFAAKARDGDAGAQDAFEVLLRELAALEEPARQAMADLAAALPRELQDDADTMAEVVLALFPIVAATTSAEELMQAMEDLPSTLGRKKVVDAAAATLRIDEVTRAECDVVIAD